MPRIRSVKPEFFTSQDTGTLDAVDQLTYQGLWLHADREGRLKDRPTYLKTQIHPYREMDMEQSLKVLAKKRLIVRYSYNGCQFLAIPTFLQHQYPHWKEPASTIPAPDSPGASPSLASGKTESSPSTARRFLGTVLRKGTVKDVGAELSGEKPLIAAPDLPSNLQGWLQDSTHLKPMADKRRARFWKLLEKAYDQYPWLYFQDEIAKMDSWIEANPQRKPTERGLPRFIRAWFERAVEMGRKNHAQRQRT